MPKVTENIVLFFLGRALSRENVTQDKESGWKYP